MRAGFGYWVAAIVLATAVPVLTTAGPAFAAHRAMTVLEGSAICRPEIGSIDVQRLQTEYQKANELQSQYEADEEKFQADLQEGQKEIQRLEATIASEDAAAQAATSDIKVKQQHVQARDAAQAKLDATQAAFAERLHRRREQRDALARELNGTLLIDAKNAVAKVAKHHHLEAVIDSRVGLLGLPDLTDEVLDILNATASARQ